MNTSKLIYVSAFLFLLTLGCSSRKSIKIDSTSAASDAPVVSLRFEWIKEKGDKYDMRLIVKNGTDKSILFYLNELHCFKGSVEGTLKHTFFNTGHRTFKFHPGAQEAYNMVCKVGDNVQGDYRVVLGRVLENPTGDGKTPGKQIAEKIEVVQKSQ